MLHLIIRALPGPVARTGLRVAHAIRLRWWRLTRPVLHGCRILAIDGAGRVLLVRHSYGSGVWMLPGGGIRRGEDPRAAAARELAEETGCTLDDAHEAGVDERPLSGARNRSHLIVGRTDDTPRADGREIIDARFFATDALPQPLGRGLGDGLARMVSRYEAASNPPLQGEMAAR